MAYLAGIRGYGGLGDDAADARAALDWLRSQPTVYTLAPFGRIVADTRSGSWFAPDYNGGSTISPDVMAGNGLPRTPSSGPGVTQESAALPDPYHSAVAPRTLVQQAIYDSLMRGGTWNASLESQIRAELQQGVNAGLLTPDEAARVLAQKDDPAKAQADALWLPPGAPVPKIADRSYISDTGQIHPDLADPEEQKRALEVIAYTAAQKGTTFQEEAAKVADRLVQANPGETFEGIEKLAQGIRTGTVVNLSPSERYGAGVAPENAPAAASSAPKLVSGLLLAGLPLLFFTLKKHKGHR